MSIASHYRQIRARGFKALTALAMARRYENETLTEYRAKLEAWKAQPDKRTYAPGGSANRPAFPALLSTREPEPVCYWRDAGTSESILDLRHHGWYADAFQDETYAGRVWRLPARKGVKRYVAGYVEACAEYVVFVMQGNAPEIFDNKRDAARAADRLAERNAESEREYSEKWQEASSANDERDEARKALRGARVDARAAVQALRELRNVNANSARELALQTLETAREEMREAIAHVHACADKIADLGMKGEF